MTTDAEEDIYVKVNGRERYVADCKSYVTGLRKHQPDGRLWIFYARRPDKPVAEYVQGKDVFRPDVSKDAPLKDRLLPGIVPFQRRGVNYFMRLKCARGRRYGVVVVFRPPSGDLTIGWSRCHRRDDWNRYVAIYKATKPLPHPHATTIADLVFRSHIHPAFGSHFRPEGLKTTAAYREVPDDMKALWLRALQVTLDEAKLFEPAPAPAPKEVTS